MRRYIFLRPTVVQIEVMDDVAEDEDLPKVAMVACAAAKSVSYVANRVIANAKSVVAALSLTYCSKHEILPDCTAVPTAPSPILTND